MKKILTIVGCAFISFSAMAQHRDQRDLKEAMRESLRESLKEKWRPTRTLTSGAQLSNLAKGTTVPDGRISTAAAATQEGEVSLAYHPLDSNKMVISYMEEVTTGSNAGLNFPIYYSSNGGQSWTKSSFNSKSPLGSDATGQFEGGGGDPVFAWDKNGRVYFSWIYLTVTQAIDTGNWFLYWAYSDNNGQTWTIPSAPNRFLGRGKLDLNGNALFNYGDGVTDRQWMAVDNTGGPNQGTLYCSFLNQPADGDPNKFGEAVKTKSFSAASFGPAVVAYNSETQFGNVEVAPNGTLHLTLSDLFDQTIRHVSSSNAGASFSTDHLIASGDNLFGQTGFVHDRENAATNLAVDGTGNLHIVWSSYPTTGVESYYSRSTDGGLTWSAPKDLSAVFTGRKAFMPTVAAFGNNVSISMAGVDANDSGGYYQIRSTDNGATWGWVEQLSSAQSNYKSYTNNEFFGDYNRSQRTKCMTYSAWSDGRKGLGPKMYFARTTSCYPTSVQEITAVNGNLQLEGLFPNPASTQIILKLNAKTAGKFTASLNDMTGKTLWRADKSYGNGQSDATLPLGAVATGAYMLSIVDSDGGMITRQIVVQ